MNRNNLSKRSSSYKGILSVKDAVKILTLLNRVKASGRNFLADYDIDWGRKKIEVKMSCASKNNLWHWNFPNRIEELSFDCKHRKKVEDFVSPTHYLLMGYFNNYPKRCFLVPNEKIRLGTWITKRVGGKNSWIVDFELKIGY
jgi:hypothetical protein